MYSRSMTTIYITGDINEETVRMVHQELSKDSQQVDVIITSHGGLASAGLAIYDMLSNEDRPVTTYIAGCAASAAAIIFLSGHSRRATENSHILFHRASTRVGRANQSELYSVAAELDRVDRRILKIAKPHLTKKQYERLERGEDVILYGKKMRKQGMLK